MAAMIDEINGLQSTLIHKESEIDMLREEVRHLRRKEREAAEKANWIPECFPKNAVNPSLTPLSPPLSLECNIKVSFGRNEFGFLYPGKISSFPVLVTGLNDDGLALVSKFESSLNILLK